MIRIRITLIMELLLLAVVTVNAAGIFTVSGREILLDGAPYEVRGMCYQPAPIGQDPSAAPPYGDYFTAGYSDLWTRDFPNLRLMGANVVRIYGWTVGADHTAFLDAAYNDGDESLYLLVNKYINPWTDWTSTSAVDALAAEWEAIADELKDHPAVMGFLIGNEVNVHNGNGDNPDFWAAMNRIAGAVKAVASNKLVSVAITDALDQVESRDTAMTNLDFWGIQVYRGVGFGRLFTDYAADSSKPLVITEFGHDAYDAGNGSEFADDAEVPADAMENLWNELRYNRDVAAGACVFEYADEWWKAGNPSTHDTTGWPSGAFIDGEGNEEWWGVFRTVDNGTDPDLLERRSMFYRLAAMWNEPFTPVFQNTTASNGLVLTEFSYPEHLRDQPLRLMMSGNLDTWFTVARSSSSNALDSYSTAVTLSTHNTGDEVQVSLVYDPEVIPVCDPFNLLVNGGFETVNTLDWLGWGAITSDLARDGSRSLRLSAPGGFNIPLAVQSASALPGEEYNLSGYIYTPAPLPADATFGLLKIVFRDASGTELVPASVSIGVNVTDPGFPGAESRPVLDSTSPAGEWLFSEVQAVAPSNTASVAFLAINVDQSANTMYFDSLAAVEVVDVALTNDAGFFRVINPGR